MVPGAAWPGSDQWPWGTAPAAGPAGQLGRPSVSDPWGVAFCILCSGLPWGACVCGVHSSLALVHRCCVVWWCACLVRCVCGVHGSMALVHRLCCVGGWRVCLVRCVRGVRGSLALVHRCARFMRCVCGVHGSLALVHRCVRFVCCVRGVHGSWALAHRCARCVRCVCGARGSLGLLFFLFEKEEKECTNTTGIGTGSVQQCSVLLCGLLWRPHPRGAARVLYCTWVWSGSVLGQRFWVWVRLRVVAAGAVSGSAGGFDGAGRGSWWSIFRGGLG